MRVALLILFYFKFCFLYSQSKTVLYCNFDTIEKKEQIKPLVRRGIPSPEINRSYFVKDENSTTRGKIHGVFHKQVKGVIGNALQLDGNTSFVEAVLENDIEGDFSVGAWIALGAYPTHWCPVADQNIGTKKGFFLGVDANGHAGFKVYIEDKLIDVQSGEKIQLRQWVYIQGVYSPSEGILLYLNGKLVASAKSIGDFVPASSKEISVGKSTLRQKPEGTVRPNATEAVYTFFDGLIDELKIYDNALKSSEIVEYYQNTKPSQVPELAIRNLPLSDAKPTKFGGVYAKLKYYESWDKPWPMGDNADVVINFDENASKFVFWRGTSYIPHWITENGIWYNNEFLETWSAKGSHEPMSDKRCQFSNVRIIETNDARVVVHWRYALIDNWNEMARVDSLTGFGEWADELYTIYPDGVATRKITLYSSQPQSAHEWHEGIVVMGPGQRPEQVLEPEGLTLANMKGETHVYDWSKGIPTEADKQGYVQLPESANIHVINTKSILKPFVIIDPQAHPKWNIYNGELRRDVSMYPWWNHWPAAQKASDGRYAMDSDYASHSSLTNANWDAYELTEDSHTKIMLHGLTSKKAQDLINLTKSWSKPAKIKLADNSLYAGGYYVPSERAYHVISSKKLATLNFTLEANSDSPIENASIIVKNWGNHDVSLKIDNIPMARSKAFRYGFRDSLEGTDLVVWIEKKSIKPLNISLLPIKK